MYQPAVIGVPIEDVPTALYRLYDAAGTLLYVGITDSLKARFRQHAKEKSWWPDAAAKTVIWYGSRHEAD